MYRYLKARLCGPRMSACMLGCCSDSCVQPFAFLVLGNKHAASGLRHSHYALHHHVQMGLPKVPDGPRGRRFRLVSHKPSVVEYEKQLSKLAADRVGCMKAARMGPSTELFNSRCCRCDATAVGSTSDTSSS